MSARARKKIGNGFNGSPNRSTGTWPARSARSSSTAWAELGPTGLRVRFGLWRLHTPLANISGAERTGGFAYLKTAGPPHLSFADRGTHRFKGLKEPIALAAASAE